MKKILTVGFFMIGTGLWLGTGVSPAGDNGTLFISAHVLPNLFQTTISQPTNLSITPRDIAMNYIDVEAGTVMHVTMNDPNGYYLNFIIEDPFIKSMDVKLNGRTVSVQAGGGLIHLPFPGISGETVEISYRLYLSPDIPPGTYPWPVTVIPFLI